MAEKAVSSEEHSLLPELAESEERLHPPSPPAHAGMGEATSRAAPSLTNMVEEADSTMAEADASFSKTQEEATLTLGQGEIGQSELPPSVAPVVSGQPMTMTPSTKRGGNDDFLPPESARRISNRWRPGGRRPSMACSPTLR